MKRYIYTLILTLVFSSSLLMSCDLNTASTVAIDESEATRTIDNNEKIINGTMRTLMESFYSYANPGYGAFLRTGDAMGSDVALNRSYGFSNQYSFKTLYSDVSTNIFSWSLTYEVINNMNRILESIDTAQGNDEKKRMQVKAQALGMRAFMYLHLASNYAFAIDYNPDAVCAPIYTENNFRYGNQPAGSVSEVYKQALEDAELGLTILPKEYNRSVKWQIDRSVLLGLASRIALYSRQWEKAANYSDELLKLNSYLMNEVEYKSGFNDIANKEWIWGHVQTSTQDDASYQFNFLDVTSSTSYYYSFNADPYFKELFDDTDYRKDMIYWATDPGKDPSSENFLWMRYAKFKFKENNTADIVLMRTSEIYLINAEAKARLNHPDALKVLNTLKEARKAQPVSLSGQDLIDAIWVERRKELFGEGFSMVDIIRNQQSVERKEYPQTPIEYKYIGEDGKEYTKMYIPQGHRILTFPDKNSSKFTKNSPFYLYRITQKEIINNERLYEKYPRPDFYS